MTVVEQVRKASQIMLDTLRDIAFDDTCPSHLRKRIELALLHVNEVLWPLPTKEKKEARKIDPDAFNGA